MQRSSIIAGLLFLALAPGCGGSGSSGSPNSIKIESVTASAASGFTATVSYDLQTAESAVIAHCYLPYLGDQAGDSWLGCPLSFIDAPVGRGKGTITITDWEPFTGTKNLCAILMPNQYPNSTVGVVSDVQTIIAQ
jgi:hypothetical protein